MKVVFRFQDVTEIVSDEVSAFEANTNDIQKAAHKEQMKRDGKALFYSSMCES